MSLMGMDIGTTGCKAVVFSEDGRVLSSRYREYPLHIPERDRCELDPEEVWQAVLFVVGKAASEAGAGDPVKCLGISTLGDSVTFLDRKGAPVHRTIVGAADRRALAQARWIEERMSREEIFSLTGAPLHAYSVLAKILWMKEERPDIDRRVDKYTGWQEIVHLRFGLDPSFDHSLASRTMLMDVRKKDWAVPLLSLCGVPVERFYPLAPSISIVGRIGAKAAEATLLPAGTAVAAGGFDQCCCALGAGVSKTGTAALTIGTLEAITPVFDTCRLELPLLAGNHGCGLHVIEGMYFTLAYVTTSGAVLRWYRDTLGGPETAEAHAPGEDQRGLNPYDIIVGQTPDRPSSVFVLPYFAGAGTPWLDVRQKGSVFGLTLDTDRAELVKGILDGICYEVKLNLESFSSAGVRIEKLRAAGGGAKSDRLLQLRADVTGIPVEAAEVTEAGCLGAAFLAGLGTGTYASIDDIGEIVRIRKTFEPRPAHEKRYAEGFETYKKLRARMEGLNI